jgi:hypothetical protein
MRRLTPEFLSGEHQFKMEAREEETCVGSNFLSLY